MSTNNICFYAYIKIYLPDTIDPDKSGYHVNILLKSP